MNTSHKLANLQQAIYQKRSKESSHYTFFNQLTSPELLETVESLLPEHRERNFPPTETLSMFLSQAMNADRSCQNIVNEAALTKALYGMQPCSSNTGSYCKARKRLPIINGISVGTPNREDDGGSGSSIMAMERSSCSVS